MGNESKRPIRVPTRKGCWVLVLSYQPSYVVLPDRFSAIQYAEALANCDVRGGGRITCNLLADADQEGTIGILNWQDGTGKPKSCQLHTGTFIVK